MNVKYITGRAEKAILITIAFFAIAAMAWDRMLRLDQKMHPFFCWASALSRPQTC